MRGLLAFLYGVAAYLAALATLAYFVGFSADLLVPRSVDLGPHEAWPVAFATDVILLALFGAQHSVMARRGFKLVWTRLVPRAIERSTFLFATCSVMAALMWFWLPIETPVWRVDEEAARTVLWAGFWLGWMLAVFSTYLLDHFELFGLRQVVSRLTGRAAPEATFRTPLLYRHVRHPLYLGFLLGLWSVPTMSAGHLLFSVGLTVYILIGISFEERDLMRQFGERYRRYRNEVGMLIPRLGGRAGAAGEGRSAE